VFAQCLRVAFEHGGGELQPGDLRLLLRACDRVVCVPRGFTGGRPFLLALRLLRFEFADLLLLFGITLPAQVLQLLAATVHGRLGPPQTVDDRTQRCLRAARLSDQRPIGFLGGLENFPLGFGLLQPPCRR
jgi:hypothetical protein